MNETMELNSTMHILLLLCFVYRGFMVECYTNPNDFRILNEFRNGLDNSELLKWPRKGNDPCGPPTWPHVFCSNGRVTQIQVQGLGLSGILPKDFNQLDKLINLGFQRNNFSGSLPSFSGLSDLRYAYLDFNQFDSIPADFFRGLSSVQTLALDNNPFNESSGWSIPSDLAESTQLSNFSCYGCNIVGPVPDFFGRLPSLTMLRLSRNRLNGGIPSSFINSMLQVLWLNDQDGGGMTGPIDVIGSMVGLTQLWLHGNQLTGPIPDNVGDLTSLKDLDLNGNRFVGLIPSGLADLNLQRLDLNNNMFMGPVPKFRAENVTFKSNSFCQSNPGQDCAPEVNALLGFLRDLNYPERLASEWIGNDPCGEHWWGISCDASNHVSVINLQRLGLNGTLSPLLVSLLSLREVHLQGNNLHGRLPANLTQLRSLRLLDLTGNNFEPPLPRFPDGVRVVTDGNLRFANNAPIQSPSPDDGESPADGNDQTPADGNNQTPGAESPPGIRSNPKKSPNSGALIYATAASGSIIFIVAALLLFYCLRKKKMTKKPSGGVISLSKDSIDHGNMVKIAVVDTFDVEAQSGNASQDLIVKRLSNSHMSESGNLVISFEVLRKATNNFAKENELGHGGFGVVYKGESENRTKLAVKRMVAGNISFKMLEEFQSEIAVLSSVRHRHLVSLLGFSVENNERLLVYEYMPQGALSRHLFHWQSLNLEPLSWKRRLSIALDVARGVEYLHTLAHQSFIHRDLKSANILLDDDFRAKVSDFGLVKLAPDRNISVATRLAGTFGYLAPEYAVTGKITTKVDIFSFGVILMELLTGLTALDEQRTEEKRYLAEWFWHIKDHHDVLISSIDPSINTKEEIHDKIYVIAELAGHCTARDPNHRPEMGHVVNVLSQLIGKWKPCETTNENSCIDLTLPLPQMLKGWQEEPNTRDFSGTSQDTEESIPDKSMGFPDNFHSGDAR